MRLLIDTHMVIWTLSDSRQMPGEAYRMTRGAEAVCISAASVFEIAVKASRGKLAIPMNRLMNRIEAANFEPLPITWAHALRAHDFNHPDPFDRLLIAQAEVEPLHLLTVKDRLAAFSS